MAVYDLEEQEKISELKAWWEMYGKYITGLLVVAALASIGWQAYQWYQNKQAAEAGALYYIVQKAAEQGDAARTKDSAGRLIEQFPRTAYADFAALMSAHVQIAAGDTRNARAHLEWLATQGNNPLLRDMARLRMATLLLEEGALKEALAQLPAAPARGLKARTDELRGDILAAQGEAVLAREAYQAALATLATQGFGAGDPLYEIITVKSEAAES
jgi:predicted negative regulator of RcsB-dependent stress response